jgi:Flp pilus assembly protein TadB
MSANGDQTPPAGEELHIPAPSALPLLVTGALTLLLLGLTKSLVVVGVAVILLVSFIVAWIRGSVREHRSLPAHHEH